MTLSCRRVVCSPGESDGSHWSETRDLNPEPAAGWGEFLGATASPGNGGPLRAPRGQTSVFYK